jgi:deoxyribodipyrimidine photo-lyase
MSATIVWFRQDLRLQDNAALGAAVRRGAPIVPVYVWDERGEGRWPPGAAARSWLHRSLASLDASLRGRGSRLVLARGSASVEIPRLVREVGADAVYWNKRYEPAAREAEVTIATALTSSGVAADGFTDAVLFDPELVRNRQGGPFQVFTPFWRTCTERPVAAPAKLPAGTLPSVRRWPASVPLDELKLEPRVTWDGEFYGARGWQPGEAGAENRLRTFGKEGIAAYADARDQPDGEGTSRLSPHLHFGEVSPRQVWAAVANLSRESGVFPANRGAAVFLKELGWREFAYHSLVHFPRTPEQPLREAFARFPWAADPGGKLLRAWTRGATGYPIVDAGMRQLWRTGWMHNRVRMIVASFLVKHLRLPWTEGAAWFWDTLVDADLANNTLGWQWSAGCGADAAPYFRIFAPVTQGQKFDHEGAYVRRWVPELARVPVRYIHAPWEAPASVLGESGVRLGEDYPMPIVDHASARAAALAAFRTMREGGEGARASAALRKHAE